MGIKVEDINDLACLVEKTFGNRAKIVEVNTEKKDVVCMLYDAFLFRCSIGDRYGVFGGAIEFGKQEANITNFIGGRLSLNSDDESIMGSIKRVDNYCRLRLPDKYLDAYSKAYPEN